MEDSPVFDTHVLLASPDRFRMPFLGEGYFSDDEGTLHRSFSLEEYEADARPLGVARCILMEVGVGPAYSIAEARALTALGADPMVAGVIAAAPVEDGRRVEAVLDELQRLGPLVRGARRVVEHEVDDFPASRGFIEGAQALADRGLVLETSAKRWHLPALVRLMDRAPDVRLMIDHAGKPDPADPSRHAWQQSIRALAQNPNVYLKLSGLLTELPGDSDAVPHVRRIAEIVLDGFGPRRVVFGGDWPVGNLRGGLEGWVDIVSSIPGFERHNADFWDRNAGRFYLGSG